MSKTEYAKLYREFDFRRDPTKYRIGRGEQGVLIAEPYKSELLPHWRFKSPDVALASAQKLYQMFQAYLDEDDFVGADMARKYLQMGWTRSRRYANHSTGRKYHNGKTIGQDDQSEQSEKAESAKIFFQYYQKAKDDERYVSRKKAWQMREKELFR